MRHFLFILLICAICGVYLSDALGMGEAGVTKRGGMALVRKQGETTIRHAAVDMPLYEGDEIETMEKAFCDIAFAVDGKEPVAVRIKENTILTIKTINLTPDKERLILDISLGNIIIKENRLSDDAEFTIITPTSTIEVQGKDYIVK